MFWSQQAGSNRWPALYESAALPTELCWQHLRHNSFLLNHPGIFQWPIYQVIIESSTIIQYKQLIMLNLSQLLKKILFPPVCLISLCIFSRVTTVYP